MANHCEIFRFNVIFIPPACIAAVSRASEIVKGAVKDTTTRDYRRYIPRWKEYINNLDFGDNCLMDDLPLSSKLVLIINFMDKENEEGHDYSKAVTAVRCYLRDNLRGTEFFENELIAAARKSLRPNSRVLNERRVTRIRLPTPYEFVQWMRIVYWDQGDIDTKMCYLGVAVSYNYGLRSSEYTHDNKLKGEHAVMAKDVFFVSRSGGRVMPWEIISTSSAESIVSGSLSVVSSKTITDGIARTLFLSRVSPIESQLLDDILLCCIESKVKATDIFFSRYKADKRGIVRRKQLIPKMVSAALKAAAVTFGLPESMFSTHCNRIGCASDLAAYGLQDPDLKKFIGWKSDSSFLYQRGSEKDPSALRAGASGRSLTISDVTSLIPVGRSGDLLLARKSV